MYNRHQFPCLSIKKATWRTRLTNIELTKHHRRIEQSRTQYNRCHEYSVLVFQWSQGNNSFHRVRLGRKVVIPARDMVAFASSTRLMASGIKANKSSLQRTSTIMLTSQTSRRVYKTTHSCQLQNETTTILEHDNVGY